MKSLDRFGKFVVAKLRDAAIDHTDGLLRGHWKAPGSQPLQSDLGRLTAEQREVVRRCVIEAVDGGIHDFLFAPGEAHEAGSGIAVTVEGQDSPPKVMDFRASRTAKRAGLPSSVSTGLMRTPPDPTP